MLLWPTALFYTFFRQDNRRIFSSLTCVACLRNFSVRPERLIFQTWSWLRFFFLENGNLDSRYIFWLFSRLILCRSFTLLKGTCVLKLAILDLHFVVLRLEHWSSYHLIFANNNWVGHRWWLLSLWVRRYRGVFGLWGVILVPWSREAQLFLVSEVRCFEV